MVTILAVGLFNSIMFPTIFTLAIDGLGDRTGQGLGHPLHGDRRRRHPAGPPGGRRRPHRRCTSPSSSRWPRYAYIAWYGLVGSVRREGATGTSADRSAARPAVSGEKGMARMTRLGFERFAVAVGALLVGALSACASKPSPRARWQLVVERRVQRQARSTRPSGQSTPATRSAPGRRTTTRRARRTSASPAGTSSSRPRAESYQGASYTSGRIETGGRSRRPTAGSRRASSSPPGQGMWPAFWLLGANYATAGLARVRGDRHHGGRAARRPARSSGACTARAATRTPRRTRSPPARSFGDGFHLFALEWEPGVVRWYVDGALYETQSADLSPRASRGSSTTPSSSSSISRSAGSFGGPIASATAVPAVDARRLRARLHQRAKRCRRERRRGGRLKKTSVSTASMLGPVRALGGSVASTGGRVPRNARLVLRDARRVPRNARLVLRAGGLVRWEGVSLNRTPALRSKPPVRKSQDARPSIKTARS